MAADRTAVEADRKAAEALIPEIEEKKSAAVKAVEEKGAATLASIPEDYSTLAARVDNHDVNKVAIDRGNLWNGEYESGYMTSAGKVAEHNLTEYTKPIYLYPGTYLYRRYSGMFGSNAGNVFLTDETGAVKSVIAEAGMDETLDVSMVTLEKGHYCFNISKGSGAAQQMIIAGDGYEDWPDEQRAYGDVRIEEGVGFNAGMRALIDAQVSAIVDGAIVSAFDDIEIGEIIATYVSVGGTQLTGAYHCEIAARAGEQYQFKCRTGSAVTQAVLLSEDRSTVLGICGTTGETWNTLHAFDTTFIVPADGVLCVNDIYGDILAVRKLVYQAATDADVAGKIAVQV